MNLHTLIALLDYNYWARDRMFDALDALTPEQFNRDLGSSFKSIRETVVHVYAAEVIWHSRWTGQAAALKTSEAFPDPGSVRREWTEHEGKMQAFLKNLGDSGALRVFSYKTLGGDPVSSPFWQMLQHVVNHGSYHRGQVTTMLRQVGAAPPKSMDMIAFYRMRS